MVQHPALQVKLIPASVTYYVKGTVIAGDSAPTIVLLTKWNTTTNKRDTIGGGGDYVNSSVNSSTYTAHTFSLVYPNASLGTPDTMLYIITSSVKTSGSATIGTSITVDDISFAGNEAGISSHTAQNTVIAYPNPAVNQITLASTSEKAKFAAVYDLTGRMVGKYDMLNKQAIVDLNAFQNGMYIYVITDEANHTLANSKFSVSK